MVLACEKFRPYVLGSHVVTHTDHAAKISDGKERGQTKIDQMGITATRV